MSEEIMLTPQGVKKLKEELDERKDMRSQIADKIAQARELGDLSENAEYHQARDEQGFNEGRIMEIENLLKQATIVEKKNDSIVGIGSVVKMRNDEKEFVYTIVGATEADPAQGKISCESPLGVAFIGKKVGDKVEVKTPTGVNVYKILAID